MKQQSNFLRNEELIHFEGKFIKERKYEGPKGTALDKTKKQGIFLAFEVITLFFEIKELERWNIR